MLGKIQTQYLNVKTSKIVSQIQKNILNKLFGSEHVNVKTLLQTTSQITPEDSQGYEFELRLSDENGHTSKDTWINFDNQFNDKITMISFDDDIIYNYETHIPLTNIHFRSYQKSNMYERKMLINMIVSRTECKNIIPMNIKLSKETLMSPTKHLNKYINIQRRQRYSYKFKDPKLKNWRIDKTIRFFSDTINDKKMTIPISIENGQRLTYYDYLDIELEYIGEFSKLYDSFFSLIETLYKPYEDFNVIYNVIKYIITLDYPKVNSILPLIPSPTILTNNVLQSLKVQDFTFSFKLIGEHVIIAVFGNLEETSIKESDVDIYVISNDSMIHIYGCLSFINKKRKKDLKISNRLKSFIVNSNSDKLPLLSLFEAEYSTSNNMYMLLDTIYYNSSSIEKQPLNDRLKYIEKFVAIKNDFIKKHFITNVIFNSNDITWEHLINYVNHNNHKLLNFNPSLIKILNIFQTDGIICKQNKATLFTSTVYKIKNSKSSTIDFKVCYVPLKKIFLLYVIGNVDQVIKSKSLINKNSIEHFGYSLLNIPNGKDVHILFVSPFMKNSFIFKPRLDYCKDNFDQNTQKDIDKLMKDIYTNPMKYHGSVLKMSKVNDGWVPIANKGFNVQANTYLESLKNSELIYDKLKHNIDINKHKTSIPPLIRKLLKTIYLLLNQYVIEKYFNKEKFESILDIFDEDNIFINMLYNIGLAKKVFAVNSEKYVLNEYVECSIKKYFNETLLIEGVKKRDKSIYFDLSIIHSPLSNENIIDKLNKQYLYMPKSIDVIYFQTGLDDIKSFIDLIDIRMLCENVLSPNGKIIFKLYDGDKIVDFLEHNFIQTERKNKKVVDKTLGITYLNDDTIKFNETIDDYIVPNPESIKMVNSNEVDDNYQYENIEIETYKQPLNNRLNVTVRKTTNQLQIKYSEDLIYVQKPEQYSNVNIEKLGLVCYYYFKFNRYDKEGNFKSTKYLTKTQTKNLKSILGINTELFSNIYDRTLDNWYSIYHNVDKLFGSKDYSQIAVYNGIDDGVLIEKETLDETIIEFIENRINSKYSTVIVTKTKLNKRLLFKVPLNDYDYNMYVIFPNFITNNDVVLLKNYLTRIMNIDSEEEIFKYYTCPRINENIYTKKLIFRKEFFTFIFESFKLYDICVPLTQTEVATYISLNRKFSQIETVENFLNSLTVLCVERV